LNDGLFLLQYLFEFICDYYEQMFDVEIDGFLEVFENNELVHIMVE
jgi:hypothetical protein